MSRKKDRYMSLEELKQKMKKLHTEYLEKKINPRDVHVEADGLLLKYVGDEELSELFHSCAIWYA